MAVVAGMPLGYFDGWHGPLFGALLGLAVADLPVAFMPANWAFVQIIGPVCLFGGLAILATLFLAQTDRLRVAANTHTRTFDPLSNSIAVLITLMQVFGLMLRN